MNTERADRPATGRLLNLNDLSAANCLARDERIIVMRAILADLRSVESITGHDAAGIPRRATPVFAELLEGRSIRELASAYVELRLMGAQTTVIDAIELARGVINEPGPGDRQT